MKRRGRPLGTRRLAVLDRLRRGSFTMRDITLELGISTRQADWLLRDMRASGAVAVVGETRLPGAKRPVAVYGEARAALAGTAMAWASNWVTR